MRFMSAYFLQKVNPVTGFIFPVTDHQCLHLLRRVRAEALPKMKGGLRALYRTLELPGANPLKDAHVALDTAVLTAYGFNAKKDLLAQLLALNQEVAAKIEKGSPVTAPGVPKNYPDAKQLVTDDCICATR
jgi:hypothetical protein